MKDTLIYRTEEGKVLVADVKPCGATETLLEFGSAEEFMAFVRGINSFAMALRFVDLLGPLAPYLHSGPQDIPKAFENAFDPKREGEATW